ncbi:MAG: hypothetical protein LBT30_05480 [Clostridiales bacterium]|jgi:hypothetical protein|nr:hypothetical protein [Clostridiales bacterium]
MYLKYSVSILLSNLGLVFKTFLYSVCILLAAAAIGAGILVPTLKPVYEEIEADGYIDEVSDVTNGLLRDGNIAKASEEYTDIYNGVVEIIRQHTGKLFFSYGYVVFLMLLVGFFKATFDYASASLLNDYMSSKLRSRLMPKYLLMAGKSYGYAALKVLISGALTAVIFLLLALFVRYTAPFINFFTATFAILISILLLSLKFVLFADWLPNILNGDKVGDALKKSVKDNTRLVFGNKFTTALCFYTVMTICVLTFTLTTFGFILLIIIPISTCLLRIMELTNYYASVGNRFYTDDFTIKNPVKNIK